ncbi:site-specific recombinase XerC [Rhizobium sp. BK538]|nr:site-specific recombinase XerC [Rhizobium sp. BK538]
MKMKIGSLVTGTEIRTRAMVVQQKTGRPVQFEITAEVRASLLTWLKRRGETVDDYAFPSRVDHTDHLSTCQYARLVDEWVTAIGLRREDDGTHSLRRTKAAMIDKATGNLRAIQILLGHTKIENTVKYLGVDIEDALELAEHTEI